MKSWTIVFGIAVCLTLLASAGQAGTTKTIKVDCFKGDSINAALEDKAEELIVEISGFCQEKVVIRRSGVTLRGSDPALDGIRGIGAGGRALVEVWDSSSHAYLDETLDVTLESLSLTDSGIGLFVSGSTVRLANCRFLGHAESGAFFAADAFAYVTDTRFAQSGIGLNIQHSSGVICERCGFEENGQYGMRTYRGGLGYCGDCEFLDNDWAVLSISDGHAFVWDSLVSGDRGLAAGRDGLLSGDSNEVSTSGIALHASEQAEVRWSGGLLTGSIQAEWKSLVSLSSAMQLDSAGGNQVRHDSTILIHGGTTLDGTTTLDTFSNGEAIGGSAVGSLSCINGGDLFCDESVSKSASNCGLCP